MPLKPDNPQDWTIKECIIEDPVSGLTFQFEVPPNGEPHLRIYERSLRVHQLFYGNRDFVFKDGKFVGAGTNVNGLCKPGWITDTEGGDDGK